LAWIAALQERAANRSARHRADGDSDDEPDRDLSGRQHAEIERNRREPDEQHNAAAGEDTRFARVLGVRHLVVMREIEVSV
jgi:hypothetical protein